MAQVNHKQRCWPVELSQAYLNCIQSILVFNCRAQYGHGQRIARARGTRQTRIRAEIKGWGGEEGGAKGRGRKEDWSCFKSYWWSRIKGKEDWIRTKTGGQTDGRRGTYLEIGRERRGSKLEGERRGYQSKTRGSKTQSWKRSVKEFRSWKKLKDSCID